MSAIETWPGGYVRKDAKGRRVYMIRRMLAGTRYHVSTRCTQLRAAMAELEKFEKDPVNYRAGGASDAPIHIDEHLVERFLAVSKERDNSRPWRARQRNVLAWWADELKGVDLRRATLRTHILPALEKVKGRPPRIAILKALYSWLRETDQIQVSEDPTLGKLRVPQARPEQWRKAKPIPKKDYEKARKKLTPIYRDGLDVLAATGWHVTELERFVRGGEILKYVGDDKTATAVLVTPHKSGAQHRTAVGRDLEKAARRLVEHGGFSESRFRKAIHDACEAAEITDFTPGRMRHTVATTAVEKGSEMGAVATFLGHRSPATTKRFYATLAVPPRVPALR